MAQHPPYRPYPWPVRFRRVQPGLELAYMDTGTGPHTLLMLHGLGSYSPSWTKTIAGMEGEARCIAMDLPNYGRSTLGDFPVTLRWLAEVVADLVADLDPGPVVLMGHSMGAQLAVWCRHLDLFPMEKLVLIAPAGFERFSPMEQQWFRTMNRPSIIRALSDSQIRRNFEMNFFQAFEDAGFMLEDRMALKAHAEAYALYSKMIPKCTQAMLDEPIWDLLPELDLPTLVLFGREDALIPNPILHRDQTTEQIAWEGTRRIPAGRLVLLPAAGHFPHWEQAALANQAIRAFLAS